MAAMVPFAWDDPFNLDDQLTEDERMIRESAHAFAQSELQPRVIDAFREEASAPELFPLMGQAGMLGVTVPEEYGGVGASYVAYGLVAREIERNPDLLLVGQPTRGVDIGAIEFIHRRLVAMRDSGKAVLLVSVELDEILSLSDRILVMFNGEIVGEVSQNEATEQALGLMMAGERQTAQSTQSPATQETTP